jgi:small subunit ribosomal protein S1
VVLSKEKAEKMKVWDDVERAFETGEPVLGRVIDRIKGGLKVDIGVPAFLPGSLVDVRPVRNLDALRGQEFRMRVIKVNKRRGNIVLSRKAVLEEENAEKKKKTLEDLEEGKILRGTVKNLTDTEPSSTSAASMGCSTSRTWLGDGSITLRRSSRSATRSMWSS